MSTRLVPELSRPLNGTYSSIRTVGAARSRPLRRSRNIQRTAQLRKPREAKSLPYSVESLHL